MTAVENDLLDGIAATLNEAGVAVWRADGTAYLNSETAVVFDRMPDLPDRCVCLTTYGNTDDHPYVALGRVMIQIRVRGLPDQARDTRTLAAAVFDALHGLTHQQWGTAHADQVLRVTSIPMGFDDARRLERSDNYAVDLDQPPSQLRPQ